MTTDKKILASLIAHSHSITEKQRRVANLVLVKGLSLTAASHELQYTKGRVRNIFQNSVSTLLNEISKNSDLRDRIDVLKTEVAKLEKKVEVSELLLKTEQESTVSDLGELDGIEMLDLTCRQYNALRYAKVRTIADLISTPAEALLRLRNVGKKTVDGITKTLYSKHGIVWPAK